MTTQEKLNHFKSRFNNIQHSTMYDHHKASMLADLKEDMEAVFDIQVGYRGGFDPHIDPAVMKLYHQINNAMEGEPV